MKNDLYLQYRSLSRPRPHWTEEAIYGGYKYIEVSEGIWLPRLHEYALLCARYSENSVLRNIAIEDIKKSEAFFKPSVLQNSDYIKTLRTITQARTFAILGYSLAAEKVLQRLSYTQIYSDADYDVVNCKKMTSATILDISSHMIVLIPAEAVKYKEHIRNWGNIITYDHLTFYEEEGIQNAGTITTSNAQLTASCTEV